MKKVLKPRGLMDKKIMTIVLLVICLIRLHSIMLYLLSYYLSNPNPLTICIQEIPKQVVLRIVKTQMKRSTMLHFIRVYTVCYVKVKTIFRQNAFFFKL